MKITAAWVLTSQNVKLSPWISAKNACLLFHNNVREPHDEHLSPEYIRSAIIIIVYWQFINSLHFQRVHWRIVWNVVKKDVLNAAKNFSLRKRLANANVSWDPAGYQNRENCFCACELIKPSITIGNVWNNYEDRFVFISNWFQEVSYIWSICMLKILYGLWIKVKMWKWKIYNRHTEHPTG